MAEIKKTKAEQQRAAIATIIEQTGWDKSFAKATLLEAVERTLCDYKEFIEFRLYEWETERQTDCYVNECARKIRRKYDLDKGFAALLKDKARTNRHFADYIKRAWCINTETTLEEFRETFKGSKRIIYKPIRGHRGEGISSFELDEDNLESVYRTIQGYEEGLVEEFVKQHRELNRLNSSSVNTVRIVTISSDGTADPVKGAFGDIIYAALRIGAGSAVIDNFSRGGLVAAVDLATGTLATNAANSRTEFYTHHPDTGTKIKGFQIPFFNEALDLVKSAMETCRVLGYIGWDIAITETGPEIIEVNTVPGKRLLQMPYVEERRGMKPLVEKYL